MIYDTISNVVVMIVALQIVIKELRNRSAIFDVKTLFFSYYLKTVKTVSFDSVIQNLYISLRAISKLGRITLYNSSTEEAGIFFISLNTARGKQCSSGLIKFQFYNELLKLLFSIW